MARRHLPALFALALAIPAQADAAPPLVTSPRAEKLGVTIYRDPERGEDLNLAWLRGYALITETRTVDLPQGRSILRLEGVAGGMLPESAIVTGLPQGVREKNLDAELLSPLTLYARATGRPVTLRRHDAKTGAIREEPAVVRSGPDGSAVVETREGVQAVDCGGPHETLAYPGVPPGLGAKPTLSLALDMPQGRRVTLTLSYLAWGFDWQTSYILHARPEGRAEMLAWVTLASSDPVSFPDATAAVVAGRLNRTDSAPWSAPYRAEQLVFHCFYRPAAEPPPPAPPPPPEAMDIVVTAQRFEAKAAAAPVALTATQENLGDLKLYRLPVATTVAARAQKQVAMALKPAVRVAAYTGATIPTYADETIPVRRMIRLANRAADGLGLPLPAGKLALFEPTGNRPVLVGEGTMRDAAVGEDIEVDVGDANQVTARQTATAEKGSARYVFTVANAGPRAVTFEGLLALDGDKRLDTTSAPLPLWKGKPRWRVTIPAGATATLRYRVRTSG